MRRAVREISLLLRRDSRTDEQAMKDKCTEGEAWMLPYQLLHPAFNRALAWLYSVH